MSLGQPFVSARKLSDSWRTAEINPQLTFRAASMASDAGHGNWVILQPIRKQAFVTAVPSLGVHDLFPMCYCPMDGSRSDS